ncbi:hypothetical protein [Mesonia sp. K4-1]|uniref:hypothetical protein n=1 Tax=Mesonia sp. K4-1 TaxID=2602760 RepID=UPI0011C85E08|nr:hypothetical protein [Mesonia sp. K4-1]TXK74881.1 hypothetical protein FT986_10260 [Mesonia sp. K4-1]
MEWDLNDYADNWKGSNSSYYQDFIDRTIEISPFLYFAGFYIKYKAVKPYAATIFMELKNNLSFTVIPTSLSPNYTTGDAQYLVDKFLQFIETGFQNE